MLISSNNKPASAMDFHLGKYRMAKIYRADVRKRTTVIEKARCIRKRA